MNFTKRPLKKLFRRFINDKSAFHDICLQDFDFPIEKRNSYYALSSLMKQSQGRNLRVKCFG